MRAIVKKEFPGRPDDEALARTIKVGETIKGDLAKVAIAEGWAKELGADVEASQPPSTPDYAKMTSGQLKTLAAERGVDISTAKNKADVIAALQTADAPQA